LTPCRTSRPWIDAPAAPHAPPRPWIDAPVAHPARRPPPLRICLPVVGLERFAFEEREVVFFHPSFSFDANCLGLLHALLETISFLKTLAPLLSSPRFRANVSHMRAFGCFAKKSSVYYKSRIGPTCPDRTVTVFKTFAL
jgi:hypothetical protein